MSDMHCVLPDGELTILESKSKMPKCPDIYSRRTFKHSAIIWAHNSKDNKDNRNMYGAVYFLIMYHTVM